MSFLQPTEALPDSDKSLGSTPNTAIKEDVAASLLVEGYKYLDAAERPTLMEMNKR